MKKLIFVRRASQVFFLVLFVYILWSTTYPLAGIFPPEVFFKINPLITVFTSIAERVILPGIGAVLVMLLLTLILGRFFCGWVCPLGCMIDMTSYLSRKKVNFTASKNKALRSAKFYILGVIAIFSIFGVQIAWILDPMVITARFISINFIPSVTFFLNNIFIFLIKQLDFHSGLYDFYRSLKSSVLGVNIYDFSHSGIIFTFFLVICLSTLITKRLWCRAICPLGAIYALVGRFGLLNRKVSECVNCLKCKSNCRMDAINYDLTYQKGECILCMDCIYDCPTNKTYFNWVLPKRKSGKSKNGLSRREFMFLMGSSFLSLGFKNKKEWGNLDNVGNIIRPPASLKEEAFLDRCIRCGNCMKVCITNGLQPVILESGLAGIWTPQLVPEIGYCEYNCTLCGNVCPTGAISRLTVEEKHKTRLGLAEIDQKICLAWEHNQECIVCEEHCPVSNKAIKLVRDHSGEKVIPKPYIDRNLCVGCGICQNKCPTRPTRAIQVFPKKT